VYITGVLELFDSEHPKIRAAADNATTAAMNIFKGWFTSTAP